MPFLISLLLSLIIPFIPISISINPWLWSIPIIIISILIIFCIFWLFYHFSIFPKKQKNNNIYIYENIDRLDWEDIQNLFNEIFDDKFKKNKFIFTYDIDNLNQRYKEKFGEFHPNLLLELEKFSDKDINLEEYGWLIKKIKEKIIKNANIYFYENFYFIKNLRLFKKAIEYIKENKEYINIFKLEIRKVFILYYFSIFNLSKYNKLIEFDKYNLKLKNIKRNRKIKNNDEIIDEIKKEFDKEFGDQDLILKEIFNIFYKNNNNFHFKSSGCTAVISDNYFQNELLESILTNKATKHIYRIMKEIKEAPNEKEELNKSIFNLFYYDDIFSNLKIKYLKDKFDILEDKNKVIALEFLINDGINLKEFFKKYIEKINWKNINNPIFIMQGIYYINLALSIETNLIPEPTGFDLGYKFIKKYKEYIDHLCEYQKYMHDSNKNIKKEELENIIKKINDIVIILKEKLKKEEEELEKVDEKEREKKL